MTKKFLSHAEKYADKEMVWRLAQRDMVRRERLDRIKRGVIIPYHRMQPQMLIRNPSVVAPYFRESQGWSPEIRRN